MAYVPPHKRKGNEAHRSPTAEMQAPTLQKNVKTRTNRVAYADNAVLRWFGVGLHGQEMGFLPTFILQRVPLERVELKTGTKAFMLVDNNVVGAGDDNKSWTYIAERLLQDLVSSSESMKTEIEGRNQKSEEVTPKLVARFGRVLFLVSMLNMLIEVNKTRHMVYEISCLKKSFDVRLMLSNKRTLTSLMDDDIRRLIDLAVVDSDAKGGLRWPAGKLSSSGGRYRVTGVLHTVSRAYTSPSVRLKVQDADWNHFRTSAGEVLGEVILKFKDIPTKLLEKNIASDSVFKMLEDGLKLLSENFLHFD